MLPHCLIDDICLPVFENTYIVIIILLCLFIYVFFFIFLKFSLSIFQLVDVSSFQSGRSTRVWSGPNIGQRFLLDKTCPSSLH